MTKDEASDLKSLIDRVRDCTRNFDQADRLKCKADADLNYWILNHTNTETTPEQVADQVVQNLKDSGLFLRGSSENQTESTMPERKA